MTARSAKCAGHGPAEQARRFARVRTARPTEFQEDYIELIADQIAVHGEARASDLATRFGVAAATITNPLARTPA